MVRKAAPRGQLLHEFLLEYGFPAGHQRLAYNTCMPGHFVSRLMLSALAGTQGVAPLAIDLNRTHATHPLWPGHARFHVVWQSFASLFLAVPEVALLWWPRADLRFRFGVAAILVAGSLLGFVAAAAGRRLYGGSFHDPAGIRPLRFRALEVDGNALAVTAGSAVLIASTLLFFFSGW